MQLGWMTSYRSYGWYESRNQIWAQMSKAYTLLSTHTASLPPWLPSLKGVIGKGRKPVDLNTKKKKSNNNKKNKPTQVFKIT